MKICYFGIYKPEESRNRFYLKGLRSLGVEVIECQDRSRGFLKYIKLFFKHWKIRDKYDFMVVGYPGHVVVPFAKLISSKPVALDALCSLYEGVVISREQHRPFSFKAKYIRLIDRLAMKLADIVFVESEAQKKFLEEKLRVVAKGKCQVLFTGADDSQFFPDPAIPKKKEFTVVFRGKFLPEAGMSHILQAAKILEDRGVNFLIIGNGWTEKEFAAELALLQLPNLDWISDYLSDEEMRTQMLSCHLSLGQFESHERLERTIPHKCFESLAMGLPYLTSNAEGITEILRDRETCILVNPADAEDLAQKILLLKEDVELRNKIAEEGNRLYQDKFTPRVLAARILSLLK